MPIVVLLFITLFGIYITGNTEEGFVKAIQTGDCYKGLIWGSASCFATSLSISTLTKNSASDNIEWMFQGMKELFPALSVLVLAWALNAVLEDLQLGDYLAYLIKEAEVSFSVIPVITFILAAVIAFSTGSSFSTMGILIPIVISVSLPFYNQPEFELGVFYAAVASVLSGAVLGDHCSPISDTTVLSSMATGCDHINHVNSQLMYCLVCGGLAVILILLNSVLSLNLIVTYLVGISLSYLIIRLLGR